ncbi:unnamed protein product [Agarophyton chilense]|eukprot:gb/GEZJ01000363.1/.p1 GENE.gb/GEZJ01000363.1/~~gb/GEZJ01000363.1/.p1  ORF type:complete len:425 (+),score=85.73 gb/GEZJ01000363.1/:217-1491(+)
MAFLPHPQLPVRATRSPYTSIPTHVDERSALAVSRRRRVFGLLRGSSNSKIASAVRIETVCSASKRDEMRRAILLQIQQRNEVIRKSNAKRERKFKEELISLRAPKQSNLQQPTPEQPTPEQPTLEQPTLKQPTPEQSTPEHLAPDYPAYEPPAPETPAVSHGEGLDPSHELLPVPERELLSPSEQLELLSQGPKYEEILQAPKLDELTPAPKYEELTQAPKYEEITQAPKHEELVAGLKSKETATRPETTPTTDTLKSRNGGIDELYTSPSTRPGEESQSETVLEKAFQKMSKTVETVVEETKDGIDDVLENLTESKTEAIIEDKEEVDTPSKTKVQEKPSDSKAPSIGKAILDAIVEGVPSKLKPKDVPQTSDKRELIFLVDSGKVKNLTVSKLRRLLSANSLKTSGRKAELIARLTSFAKQ